MDSSKVDSLRKSVLGKRNDESSLILKELSIDLLEIDSLPPLNMETPNAENERILAREVYELGVLHSINIGDRGEFQKYFDILRSFYSDFGPKVSESERKYMIIGSYLLYLIVENRLSEYHCELELLTDEQKSLAGIKFCTELERRLMVGAYDEVMNAASNPPVDLYAFFLSSLLETVRINIADCAEISYNTLNPSALKEILMFSTEQEALEFVKEHYSHWESNGTLFKLKPDATTLSSAEDIPSQKLISQTLTYAAEMDRIV